jgi:YVTN family beta-propeller protein
VRKFLALPVVGGALLFPTGVTATSGDRPVALVTAETANEVLAVSLGAHGGRILKRVHLADPLMVAAPLHGPTVVVNPHGIVTLLGWHSLRPIKVLRGFRTPEVARIAPGDRYAYVADGGSGDLVVIDLGERKVVDRIQVGAGAHHLAFSPDGRRLWVALSEVATTVVRLDTSNLRRPRVVGRVHPPLPAHSVGFAPDGRTVWLGGARAARVMVFDATDGRLVTTLRAGRAPQEISFARGRALLTSGYGSSLESISLRTLRPLQRVAASYGSFNLASYGGLVVTTSLLTGEVSEFRLRGLNRLWTTKVAPEARYVAISDWPR